MFRGHATLSLLLPGFLCARNIWLSEAEKAGKVIDPGSFSQEPDLRTTLSTRRFCRILCGDRGGALVETAIVLPIMLLMVTGIFTFSITLHQKLQLSEAVSNGGRFLAADAGDTDPCAATAAAIYAAAPGLSQSNMTITFIIGGTNTGGTVSGGTTYTAAKGSTPSCTAMGKNGATPMQSGWPAQIQVTYPSSLSMYGAAMRSLDLSSQITEVVQ